MIDPSWQRAAQAVSLAGVVCSVSLATTPPGMPSIADVRADLTKAFPPRSACFETTFESCVWGGGTKAPADQHGGVPYQRTIFHLQSMPGFVLLKGQQSHPGNPDGELSPPRSAMWRRGVAWVREEANPRASSWITSGSLEGLFTLDQAWTFNGTDAHYPTHTRLFGSLDLLEVTGVTRDGDVTQYQLQRPGVASGRSVLTIGMMPIDGISRPIWHALDIQTLEGPFHSFLCEYFDWRTKDGITLPWGARRSSWVTPGDHDVTAIAAPARYRQASAADQSHCTTYCRTTLECRAIQEVETMEDAAQLPQRGDLVWHEDLSLAVRTGDPEVNLDGIIWRVTDPPTGLPPKNLHEFLNGAVEVGSPPTPERSLVTASPLSRWTIAMLMLAGVGTVWLFVVKVRRQGRGVWPRSHRKIVP